MFHFIAFLNTKLFKGIKFGERLCDIFHQYQTCNN